MTNNAAGGGAQDRVMSGDVAGDSAHGGACGAPGMGGSGDNQ